jgi:pentose-5-phosphate-3-epimerase
MNLGLVSMILIVSSLTMILVMSTRIMATGAITSSSAKQILDNGQLFLVYGTAWKKEKTAEHVEMAVKTGFRFIDTACQPRHYKYVRRAKANNP